MLYWKQTWDQDFKVLFFKSAKARVQEFWKAKDADFDRISIVDGDERIQTIKQNADEVAPNKWLHHPPPPASSHQQAPAVASRHQKSKSDRQHPPARASTRQHPPARPKMP